MRIKLEKTINQSVAEKQNFYGIVRSKMAYADNIAGRYFLGDDNALSRHIRSFFKGQSIKAKTHFTAKSLSENLLFKPEDLRNKGYVALNDLYDPALISTISEKINKTFSQQGRYENTTEYSLSLTHPFEDVPEIKQLITPAIVQSLENYYNCHIEMGTIDVRRTLPVGDDAPHGVYSSDWHTDKRMPLMLKLFYLVNDTTEQDGPFHIIDRKKTGNIIRKEFKSREEPGASVEKPENAVKFTGKAGSVMVANTTRCLHRAGQPEKGHSRDLIQFQFFPSITPLPANWESDPAVSRLGLGRDWK